MNTISKTAISFLVCYVFLLPLMEGQQITFNRLLDTSLALRSVTGTPDNGFVLVGVPNFECMYAMKVDSMGNMEWDHTFTERGLSSYERAIVGKDGSIWAYGEAYDRPIPRLVPHIVKYSPDGRVLWHKAYRTNPDNLEFRFYSGLDFIRLDDGSFAFTGTVTSDSLNSLSIKKGIVIRTDSNGNELWRYMFPYDTFLFNFYTVGKTRQNDIIVLATTRSSGFVLFKFNKQGQLLWRNDSGMQTGQSLLFRIVGLPNDNILVSYYASAFVSNNPPQVKIVPEYAFFDSLGNLQYIRRYTMHSFTPELYSSAIANVVLNRDSTALMAYGKIDFPLDRDSNGLKDQTYFLRTNLAGDSLASGFFRVPANDASSVSYDIALAADNGYFLLGYAGFRPPSRVFYYPRWFLKVDSLGRLRNITVIEPKVDKKLSKWSIYPNPTTQYHYIKGDFSHLKNEPIELSWTNESGQIVKRQIVQKEDILSMQFDVSAFGKGIYFVAAMQGTTYLGTKGLIIE